MMAPLAIDLFCGLGGWTDGLLAEGWQVVGFDIERHEYDGEKYPAELVLQDVRTIHGKQFRHASLIVASSPCQAYSYMAMPFSRGKAIAAALRGQGEFPEGYTGPRTLAALNELFEQPARIQREASEAAGRWIPMIQENVKGAQPWVGRAQWHYGSYYLWGDVPALMPVPMKAQKVPGFRFDGSGGSFQTASVEETGVKVPGMGWYPPDHPKHRPGQGFNTIADRRTKNTGGSWFNVAHNTESGTGQNPDGRGPRGGKVRHDPRYPHLDPNHPAYGLGDGIKAGDRCKNRQTGQWSTGWDDTDGRKGFAARFEDTPMARFGSKSSARKAASARIAKIPFVLASHIARVYKPTGEVAA